MQFKNKK